MLGGVGWGAAVHRGEERRRLHRGLGRSGGEGGGGVGEGGGAWGERGGAWWERGVGEKGTGKSEGAGESGGRGRGRVGGGGTGESEAGGPGVVRRGPVTAPVARTPSPLDPC